MVTSVHPVSVSPRFLPVDFLLRCGVSTPIPRPLSFVGLCILTFSRFLSQEKNGTAVFFPPTVYYTIPVHYKRINSKLRAAFAYLLFQVFRAMRSILYSVSFARQTLCFFLAAERMAVGSYLIDNSVSFARLTLLFFFCAAERMTDWTG